MCMCALDKMYLDSSLVLTSVHPTFAVTWGGKVGDQSIETTDDSEAEKATKAKDFKFSSILPIHSRYNR